MTEDQFEDVKEQAARLADGVRDISNAINSEDGICLAEAVDNIGNKIATAITPRAIVGNTDASGAFVESLTEAVMGVTGGLCKIAEALHEVADAIRESNSQD